VDTKDAGNTTRRPTTMLAFIALLIVVWIVLAVIGFIIKGLIWLGIIAAILFLASLVFGGRLSRNRR
jgi:quinol-cytochrome oxidoreductase complex cytochrome b subunit